MSFPAGTRLGPYEIDALIGEGGMGRVYRARDTRLDRAVAIKQLTAAHGDRFQTEARAVAALNHRTSVRCTTSATTISCSSTWRAFDRMIDDRDPFALVYAAAPVTQPLHAHPRWPALARRMRLPAQ